MPSFTKGHVSMDDLTKEQQKLLVSMYKEVLSRQPALSFEDSNYFEDSDHIRDLFFREETSDYVANICWNLESNGYIECDPGDDLANNVVLTNKTIIYMENRFKNGIKDIVTFLASLIP